MSDQNFFTICYKTFKTVRRSNGKGRRTYLRQVEVTRTKVIHLSGEKKDWPKLTIVPN